jgi:hypothetical protein
MQDKYRIFWLEDSLHRCYINRILTGCKPLKRTFWVKELAPTQLHETKFLIGCKCTCTWLSDWKKWLQPSCTRQSFLLAVNGLEPDLSFAEFPSLHEPRFLISSKCTWLGLADLKNCLPSCMNKFLIGSKCTCTWLSDWTNFLQPVAWTKVSYWLPMHLYLTFWLDELTREQSFLLAVNALVPEFLIGRASSYPLPGPKFLFIDGTRSGAVTLSYWLSLLESELSDWKNAVQPPSWRAGRTCRAASTRSSWRTPGTTATPTPRPAHQSTICSPRQDTVSHAYFCLY